MVMGGTMPPIGQIRTAIASIDQPIVKSIVKPMLRRRRMTRSDVNELVQRAEAIYSSRLQAILEPAHIDEFVAIEPESGDYFLGKTLNEAARAARKTYPDRMTHAMRIGHRAALHFGMHIR
jgi:hypothetical protein